MNFRKLLRNFHLILGFTSGLVVFIVSITGCLYAFKDEIESLQSYRYVEERDEEYMKPSTLKTLGHQLQPDRELHSVAYGRTGESAQIIYYEPDPEYYASIFVNPYDGEVLRVKDYAYDFFSIVLDGHFYLWLPEHIGQPVVASATLIFVVLLITGIILWWPKNKKVAPQRFRIKWNAKWRRKNFDLHSVLGFYVSWIVIVTAMTGLVWGFQWFEDTYYALLGGDKSLTYNEPPSPAAGNDLRPLQGGSDQAYALVKSKYPTASFTEVHFPHDEESSIYVMVKQKKQTWWQTNYLFYDQYTLEEIEPDHIYGNVENADFADTLLRMNYDIHVGAIWGLPGKILAFFISLFTASLPVTGFLLWYGRKKKNPSAKKRHSGKLKKEEGFVSA